MNYDERLAEHRRICILRALNEVTGNRASDSLLHEVLDSYALPCSRDMVRTELSWLQEQRLVALSSVGGIVIATITERGCDVARGHAIVPGVKRPSPALPG